MRGACLLATAAAAAAALPAGRLRSAGGEGLQGSTASDCYLLSTAMYYPRDYLLHTGRGRGVSGIV